MSPSALFLNPWMLAALAAATIPIIIEWLFRRRKRQIELPTIRFLLDNKEQEKIKRQDRILLILRTAAIVLLVLAIARPIIRHQTGSGEQSRNVVILIDGTASMQQQTTETTSFGLAKRKAAGVVAGLPKGTHVTVILLGDQARTIVDNQEDLHTAKAEIDSLRPTCSSAPMSGGLADIEKMLEGRKAEVYVFSDFQQNTWIPDKKTGPTAEVLARLQKQCEVFMVDCGGTPQFNYMVTDLHPVEYVMSTETPVQFQVTVKCVGEVPSPAPESKLNFIVNDEVKDTQPVANLPSGGFHHTFTYRFAKPGEYLVQAVIDGDSYRADNSRYFLCKVPESVKVLILDDSAGGSGSADSHTFANAIAPPNHPSRPRLSHFTTWTVPSSQLVYQNIDDYQVVVLAGVDLSDESMVAKLERYVTDGGTLWIFMSDHVNRLDYNRLLFKNGGGLMPVWLIETDTPAPAGAQPPYLKLDEPVAGLADLTDFGSAKEAVFMHHLPVEVRGGQVLLSLSDGTPAVVAKRYPSSTVGGRVLFTNCTAGPQWSWLPAMGQYLVMVQDLLRYMVDQPDAAVNLTVGDVFEQPVYISKQQVMIKLPDGSPVLATPHDRVGSFRDVDPSATTTQPANSAGSEQAAQASSYQLSFRDTQGNGVYEVDTIEERVPRRRFVVNIDPRSGEGDLSRLTEESFATAFGGSSWTWVSPGRSIEELAANLHTVTELASLLFWILAIMLGVESFLAWRFGRRRGPSADPAAEAVRRGGEVSL